MTSILCVGDSALCASKPSHAQVLFYVCNDIRPELDMRFICHLLLEDQHKVYDAAWRQNLLRKHASSITAWPTELQADRLADVPSPPVSVWLPGGDDLSAPIAGATQ